MKILIPTAKEMNLQVQKKKALGLSDASKGVVSALAAYSAEELAALYKIKPEKAEEEYQNIQALAQERAAAYPALFLFDGLMYRNIKRADWTEKELSYVQNHLYICSSLYGLIPALDPISPHRLDFMIKLRIQGQSLKQFWRQAYQEAAGTEDLLISLLSSEFEAVFPKEIREKMYRLKFLEEKNGCLKVHSTISKKARGQFVTGLMEEQVTTIEELKTLTAAGFVYRADLSQDRELVFVKPFHNG